MPPINKLITRGLGPTRGVPGRAGLIVQGFGGILSAVIDAGKRIVRAGQSGAKRALQGLQEIIVSARLVRANDERPTANISGFVKVRVNPDDRYSVKFIEHLSTRTRSALESLKVTIKRIK